MEILYRDVHWAERHPSQAYTASRYQGHEHFSHLRRKHQNWRFRCREGTEARLRTYNCRHALLSIARNV
jgi:hypothetical protein